MILEVGQSQRIPIEVGATHIEKGVPRSPQGCPLALALRDGHCKDWKTVSVDSHGDVVLLWDDQAISSFWSLSAEALTFLTLFDSGQRIAAAIWAGRHQGWFYIERPLLKSTRKRVQVL